MNLLANPKLLDQLAAAYALGTLRGAARRRFETLARQSPTVRASALIWQERFASMTELQPTEVPGPNVWKRIENQLESERHRRPAAVAAQPALLDKLRRSLGLWRGAALASGLASIAAVLVGVGLNREVQTQSGQLVQVSQQKDRLAAQLRTAPQIEYVAVLADGKSDASILVTFDPANQRLVLKRLGGYQEAADKSLQLWALPQSGGPKSLGVLGQGKVLRLAAVEDQVREVPTLAISLEPRGGVPGAGGPTGPVLFKGALLQTAR